MSRVRIAAIVSVLIAVAASARAADMPAWLEQAARIPVSPIDSGADAMVLLDERHVTVSDDGRITTRRMYAVRVLAKGGAEAASVREVYTTNSGTVKTMRGWLVSDGRALELGRAETADLALVENDVYNESRARLLIAPSGAITTGIVFGAETEVVERTVFTQFDWALQDDWPVRLSRRTLTVPAGWEVRSLTFNHAPIEPVRTGASYAWELRDLSATPDEPASPPFSSLVPRLAVTFMPTRSDLPSFDDWPSVSRWLAMLADPQAASHPSLAEKARQLTAGVTTELDRIRAVGRHVQGVQYISIQTGIGRGGGYKPHAAIDVFTKNYGDCKDKANLMRTLLASIGLRAHLVTIYSGDRSYVRPEWPSPQQFNHAIVAVEVGRGTVAPAVQDSGPSGRLLFFDPTDEQIPVGELPLQLQGSRGLIVSSDGGALVTMPESSAEANPTTRRVEATVSSDGTLLATVRRASAGYPASVERQIYRELRKDQYLRVVEADVRRQIPGAVLTQGEVAEDGATNRFELRMTIQAPSYAQVVQGRLMIVRPPQMNLSDLPAFTSSSRATPVVLEPIDERDVLTLSLPAEASVDEMPEVVTRLTPFGSFSVQWEKEAGRVVRTVTLRVERTTAPAASYPAVRAFFDAFADAQRVPVVLALAR